MRAIGDFQSGLTFWIKGWLFILQQRSLLKLALGPFFLAMAGCCAIFAILIFYFPGWLNSSISQWFGESSWNVALYYLLLLSSGIAAFLVLIYAFFVFQVLFALPFHALLAGRTLKLSGKARTNTARAGWRHTLYFLRVGLIKAILFLGAGLILFIFSFVAGLNLMVAGAILFLMAFDCMDYSFECLGLSLSARIDYMRQYPAQWSGMAAGLGLTLFAPGLTLLVLPGAVAGAALIIKSNSERTR